MKLLFINPPNKPFTEKSLLIEPIDILTAATYARSKGHDVRVLDMDARRMTPDAIGAEFERDKPDVTVIAFDYQIPLHTSQSIPGIYVLGRVAQREGSFVVVAGKTSKQYPALFLGNGAHVTINGELEGTLDELLRTDLASDDWRKTPQTSSYKTDRITTVHAAMTGINLDTLPIPDRGLVDIHDYGDVRGIWSSRGCSGGCSFCATPGYWGKWRARSAGPVVDEIEQLAKDWQKVIFLDDNAIVDKQRMQDISDEILRRGIDVRLGCLGSARHFDEPTVAKMYQAGFRWMHYGGESADQAVLDSTGKNTTTQQLRDAIVKTKAIGMRVRTSWVLDLQGTTIDTLRKTTAFILDTEPDEVRLHYLARRACTPFAKESFSSQYIHAQQPLNNMSGCSDTQIADQTRDLVHKLEHKGYATIHDPTEWESFKGDRFVSFCPSKYGIRWED